MTGAWLGLLLTAAASFPAADAVARRLACGTFEPQYHEWDSVRCGSQWCWDDDGRPAPPVASDAVRTYDTPGGFFKLHYTLSGVNAVPRTDLDGNGVPDYVDHFAAAFDDGLAAIRDLGFRDPEADAHGGDERFDVYFNWAGGFGGTTYFDEHSPNTRPEYPGAHPAFIAINPVEHALADEALPAWMGDLLIRQVAIHELHHAVQIGYGYGGESWVLEGMSVMIEQVVLDLPRKFPFVTDFRYDNRYRHPDASLLQVGVTRLGYANGLFYTSLLQDLGGSPAGLAKYWDAIGRNAVRDFDANDARTLVSEGLSAAGLGTLEAAFRRHTLRTLFLGETDDGRHYADGYRYHPPEGAIRTVDAAGETSFAQVLQPFGYAVIAVEAPSGPVTVAKPARADASFDWVRQYADCSTSVTPVDAMAAVVTLPAAAGDARAWFVARHVAPDYASTYRFFVTAPVGTPRGGGALTLLDAPASPTAGSEAPVVLRYDDAACRRVDATQRADWRVEPPGAARLKAGGALAFASPGPVTVTATYAGASTSVTFDVASNEPPPVGYAPAQGCAHGSGADFYVILVAAVLLAVRRRLRDRN